MNTKVPPVLPRQAGAASFRPKAPPPAPMPAPPPTAVIEETTPKAPDGNTLSSAWERVDLPSNLIPYDFDTVSLRRIVAMDHAKIVRAIRNRNMSVLLDALSATCSVDMRKLLPEDFKAVCYWHRAHSYLTAPLNVSWRSIYGNHSTVSISGPKVKYEIVNPSKTRDDYRRARTEQGFVLPTCADLEVILQIEDEEKKFMFENAQFIDPASVAERTEQLRGSSRSPSVDARIERFNTLTMTERGMGLISEIGEYREAFKFEITEKAHVTDPNFEPQAALKYLREALEGDELFDEQRVEAQAEFDRIKAAVDSGQPVEAKEEVHTLPFNVWSFFPFT